jgi:flagellar biosynthesis protein FlhB
MLVWLASAFMVGVIVLSMCLQQQPIGGPTRVYDLVYYLDHVKIALPLVVVFVSAFWGWKNRHSAQSYQLAAQVLISALGLIMFVMMTFFWQ